MRPKYPWLFCIWLPAGGPEADAYARRAGDLEPLNPALIQLHAVFLRVEGGFAEALEEYGRLTALNPASGVWPPENSRARLGDPEAAIRSLRKTPRTHLYVATQLAMSLALAGHRDEALRLVRSIEEQSERTHPHDHTGADLRRHR